MKKSQRQEKVKKLYFKDGLTVAKIAKKLKCGTSTVDRDIKAIKEIWKLEFNPKVAEEIAKEILQEEQEDIRSLKDSEFMDLKEKIMTIAEKRKLRKELFDKLARMNIIATTDNKLELSGDIKLKQEFDEILQKVRDENAKKRRKRR